jgi:hypothetical protein
MKAGHYYRKLRDVKNLKVREHNNEAEMDLRKLGYAKGRWLQMSGDPTLDDIGVSSALEVFSLSVLVYWGNLRWLTFPLSSFYIKYLAYRNYRTQ